RLGMGHGPRAERETEEVGGGGHARLEGHLREERLGQPRAAASRIAESVVRGGLHVRGPDLLRGPVLRHHGATGRDRGEEEEERQQDHTALVGTGYGDPSAHRNLPMLVAAIDGGARREVCRPRAGRTSAGCGARGSVSAVRRPIHEEGKGISFLGRSSMQMRSSSVRLLAALAWVAPCLAAAPAGAEESPFEFFNVYSCGDIGTAEAPYHSDFQGLSGASGSAHFRSMSLNDLGAIPSDYAIFVGGDFEMTGAVNHGGVEAAGDLRLHSISVDGDLAGGGDLDADGGLCDGDVRVAGNAQLAGFTVTGSVTEGAVFSPTWDHDWVADYLRSRSTDFAAYAATAEYEERWGELIFRGSEQLNVFCVEAAALETAWGVTIEAAEGQTVIVNVRGSDAELTYMSWRLSGGIARSGVLLNFYEAATLEITGIEVLGSILAPQAIVQFPAGLVQGGLWVGELRGGGQVNQGSFTEPQDPPTPARMKSWGAMKATFR
ncbi:MAG: choice-of-anchor A family protein, partial [Candidatus Eisenbacteria bacterium]|nr:choice-of-anchor A family protein [Candidatus Eisenbacteria bacterium]